MQGRRFAIVGAGIAGLACARALSEAGASVAVFESEAVPGGRAAMVAPRIVGPDTDVMELRRLMLEEHTRYLPVMDGATLMGVVSFYDVAKAVLEEQSYENRMLKAYIRDWPEQEKVGN